MGRFARGIQSPLTIEEQEIDGALCLARLLMRSSNSTGALCFRVCGEGLRIESEPARTGRYGRD